MEVPVLIGYQMTLLVLITLPAAVAAQNPDRIAREHRLDGRVHALPLETSHRDTRPRCRVR
ncbi:hypothetical protein, partial [Burkholderia sp. SIMBA_024]|uniref:hypothetical protein n=1 Tax=Burkholderia sp. SIMBA_024 TaxID=3085768 RepID=UPI00397B03A0